MNRKQIILFVFMLARLLKTFVLKVHLLAIGLLILRLLKKFSIFFSCNVIHHLKRTPLPISSHTCNGMKA
jgi:hypothetical protein